MVRIVRTRVIHANYYADDRPKAQRSPTNGGRPHRYILEGDTQIARAAEQAARVAWRLLLIIIYNNPCNLVPEGKTDRRTNNMHPSSATVY